MAKALFHKSQRVYVKPVGTWALVEKVLPHWVKDVEEPLRVTYDVGLGREFTAGELVSEEVMRRREGGKSADDAVELENWRIHRAKNRWQDGDEIASHPYPGTFPVVLTDENDWGGWRVPGSEYDRDPSKIEYQARLIMNSPRMLKVCRQLSEFASRQPGQLPEDLKQALRDCQVILRHVYEVGDSPKMAAE